MMFGIGTKKARLHVNSFTNLLGEDNEGWGLSHKGTIQKFGLNDQVKDSFYFSISRITLARRNSTKLHQKIQGKRIDSSWIIV
jgi:hypothetical protein